jgi:quinol monooxygenase YgiN
MMVNLFIRQKVKDYIIWKAAFDASLGTRQASGERSYQIFQPDDDPNNLLLFFEWDSLTNARTFMTSPEMKEVMGQAGVIESSEAYYLERYDLNY